MIGARLITKTLPLFILALLIYSLILTNCRKLRNDSFTKQDSVAVFKETAQWQDTFNFSNFFRAKRQIQEFTQLNAQDSISYTGDSLIKIYHLKGIYDTIPLCYHSDSLFFWVTSDTFCDVFYEDYAFHTISIACVDTIWLVKYQRDSLDTVWCLAEAKKMPLQSSELGKIYAWRSARRLRLKKENGKYRLLGFSGLRINVPQSDSITKIHLVTLDSDTFTIMDIDSTITLESLFSGTVGETITVAIKSLGGDTVFNPYYYFLQLGYKRLNITKGARFGQGKIFFNEPGTKQIMVEAIPAQTLFIPIILFLPLSGQSR